MNNTIKMVIAVAGGLIATMAASNYVAGLDQHERFYSGLFVGSAVTLAVAIKVKRSKL